nr:RHS repeat-associated core domain-containing protein [Wenzhouxiangella sp. XN79A]
MEVTPRGFTGHEHVDEMGLIHMNGRIYDALLGRFLQADPFVEDTTTLNRYTYVHNNPLAYTDPSGYFSLKKFFRIAAAVAISVYTGGLAAGKFAIFGTTLTATGAKFAAAVIGGAITGAISAGSVEGALWGAFAGAVFFGIGQQFAGTAGDGGVFGTSYTGPELARASVAHGVAGGTIAELQGGKFGHGFLSAGVAKAATPAAMSVSKDVFVQGAAVAIVGGTTSRISGGKFANGAVTAAMSYAFGTLAQRTGRAVGSRSGSGADPVEVPDELDVEESGFPTAADAAKAAGARYGQIGVDSRREVQLGIVKLGDNNFGYLTPGWGSVGSDIVDPSGLLSAYRAAGHEPFAWMHGHFDGQLNFSANDFWMAWERSGSTYLVNRNLEVRRLRNHHLQSALRNVPRHYPGGLAGLQRYYAQDGIPGDTL